MLSSFLVFAKACSIINAVLLGKLIEIKLEFANANGSTTERLACSEKKIEFIEELPLNAPSEIATT